jgi:serine O-acetyltransferase
MRMIGTRAQLHRLLVAQCGTLFPDVGDGVAPALRRYLAYALDRLSICLGAFDGKYERRGGRALFDPSHTDHYAMLLYLLSNTIFRDGGDRRVAARLYALNKALHALDVFYEVALPEVFHFQHPVGTVLGRAEYGNYFAAYQRCSVGSNLNGECPVLGEGVVLFGGAGIIGNCRVGDNVWLSVGAHVMDRDVPSNSVVFGSRRSLTVKRTRRSVQREIFERVGRPRSAGTRR